MLASAATSRLPAAATPPTDSPSPAIMSCAATVLATDMPPARTTLALRSPGPVESAVFDTATGPPRLAVPATSRSPLEDTSPPPVVNTPPVPLATMLPAPVVTTPPPADNIAGVETPPAAVKTPPTLASPPIEAMPVPLIVSSVAVSSVNDACAPLVAPFTTTLAAVTSPVTTTSPPTCASFATASPPAVASDAPDVGAVAVVASSTATDPASVDVPATERVPALAMLPVPVVLMSPVPVVTKLPVPLVATPPLTMAIPSSPTVSLPSMVAAPAADSVLVATEVADTAARVAFPATLRVLSATTAPDRVDPASTSSAPTNADSSTARPPLAWMLAADLRGQPMHGEQIATQRHLLHPHAPFRSCVGSAADIQIACQGGHSCHTERVSTRNASGAGGGNLSSSGGQNVAAERGGDVSTL